MQAKIALNIKHDNNFSKMEIDENLPEKLRKEEGE